MSRRPRVSIGVPVRNGERYLAATLDSLLAQTFSDFELIITDNASSDRTRDIALEYVQRDARVQYFRNPVNLGAAPNFNLAFARASGQYFKWNAHDDLVASEYLDACVTVLDRDLSAVVCHTRTRIIGEDGRPAASRRNFDFAMRLDSPQPHVRFGDIINQRRPSWIFIFGVMRREALLRTRLLGTYHSSDRNLLSELSLLGPLRRHPEALFYWRQHHGAYTDRVFRDAREQSEWWGGGSRVCVPHWRVLLEYGRSLRHMSPPARLRLLCYAQIGRWVVREGWFRIGRDIYHRVIPREVPAEQATGAALEPQLDPSSGVARAWTGEAEKLVHTRHARR